MDKFGLNEIAIFRGSGEEIEIIGLPKMQVGRNRRGKMIRSETPCYSILTQDGFEGWLPESSLRKKKPPEEPATWQEIQEISGWNPTKEVIHDQA